MFEANREARVVDQIQKRDVEDVAEVKEDFECGIRVKGYGDVRIGDLVQSYKILKRSRSLADARASGAAAAAAAASGSEKPE